MTGARVRESSIEFLRIIAMLMITFNHFTWTTADILEGTTGGHRFALLNALGFLSNWGGIGDDLFFMISAWFLCMETPTIRRSCKRFWSLEQRMLFYSLGLIIVQALLYRFVGYGAMPSAGASLLSLFPFITDKWWYTTSYIVFLLLHPFINQGLRTMGKEWHGRLIIVSLLLWGLIPYFDINMSYSVLLFLYLYSMIAYMRWYHADLLTNRGLAVKLIVVGFILGFGSNVCLQFFQQNEVVMAFWMNKPRCLPSLFMSFGVLMLSVSCTSWRSRLVNRIASCTLAMYLLQSTLDPLAVWLLRDWLDSFSGFGLLGVNILIAIACYAVALLIDMGRQLLFDFVLVRHPGKWFEKLWSWGRSFAVAGGHAVFSSCSVVRGKTASQREEAK